jgi:hypothetical protein
MSRGIPTPHPILPPARIITSAGLAAGQRHSPYATTRFERLLLMVIIMILPLEEDLPYLAGLSVVYLLFAVTAIYALFHRAWALARTWLHPIFVAAYTLIAVALLIEYSHPESNTYEIIRTAMMVAGGVFIAALFRDRGAVRVCIFGYVFVGVAVSGYLFLALYGTLQGSIAFNFEDASRIRVEAWHGNLSDNSPNTMAFYAAQGSAAALSLALAAKSARLKTLSFGLTVFCLVGAFLPMSRGGILIAVISCAGVLFAHGVRHMNTIVAAFVIGISILILVPDAVFSRLTFTTQTYEGSGRKEGRARVYTAALKHFPDYVVKGVGSGNFWGSWGQRSDFGDPVRYTALGSHNIVLGAHNGPIQILIYWGLPGLLAFGGLIYQCYRSLPRHWDDDAIKLTAYGVATSLLLFFQVHHQLSTKQFSLGLGLLAGGSAWIWSNRRVRSVRQDFTY